MRAYRPRRNAAVEVACPGVGPEAVGRGLVTSVSASTVRRCWPTTRSNPGSTGRGSFRATRPSPSRPPGPRPPPAAVRRPTPARKRVVPSADEKPVCRPAAASTQASTARPGAASGWASEYSRRQPGIPGRLRRPPRARRIGHCADTTGIAPFTALVDKVMTTKPYATARRSVLDRRHRLLAPRLDRRDTPLRRPPQRPHDPPAGARLVAQPSRDLLLRHPTQTAHPRRLRRPPNLAGKPPRSSSATTTRRVSSTGASADDLNLSIATDPQHQPRRTNGRDH